MYNEIKRKITSLTIMAIMLAGGLVAAAPGVIPTAAAANANLFVSAENSQFNNTFSGPQVVEIVVIDSAISDTDEAKGEPDVTVNGKDVRMVQAVDGNWYAYVADVDMAKLADGLSDNDGLGLDFGLFCASDSALAEGAIAPVFTDTSGIVIPNDEEGDDDGDASGADFTNTLGGAETCDGAEVDVVAGDNNVVREAKGINTTIEGGQIGLDEQAWPLIQLYDFNPTGNVVVKYNKGGGVQTTTLKFDTVDNFASVELDRTKYPTSADIQMTLTDIALNIDPTDEDSWTYGALESTTYYGLFDENGLDAADGTGNDISASLGALMFESSNQLTLDPLAQTVGVDVLRIVDNGDSITEVGAAAAAITDDAADVETAAGSIAAGGAPVTITELNSNSGIFGTYDEEDVSVLQINPDAARGTSGTASYNDVTYSIVVGLSTATVDITGDAEWTSGETIQVSVVDGDANKNSRADEDLDINDPNVDVIPALRSGTPETLDGLVVATSSIDGVAFAEAEVQRFSDRALLTTPAAVTINAADTSELVIEMGTVQDLFDAVPIEGDVFSGFGYLNYDISAIANDGNADGATTVAIDINGVAVGDGTDPLTGLIEIVDDSAVDFDEATFGDAGDALVVTFTITTTDAADNAIDAGTILPIVVDIFGFGYTGEGVNNDDRVANQIIRIEAEESGDNTSTFTGTLEYTMINQLNILDGVLYAGLETISDEPTFIVIEDLDDEESPRLTYLDINANGVATPVSDQEAAPAHSGRVSLDQESYKIADTVVVTLEDMDLNTDSDTVEIYTVVDDDADGAFDTVGEVGLPVDLSFGDLGTLLFITFDDLLWNTPVAGDTCLDGDDFTGLADLTDDTGLGATGFTLVESAAASGIFEGTFEIPPAYCPDADGDDAIDEAPVTVTGLDLEVNYQDYRDASGEIVEVGDSAGVRANTGSVSLDRTVYPVPFGTAAEIDNDEDGVADDTGDSDPNGFSINPVHLTGIAGNVDDTESLLDGDLILHVRVNDPDYDTSSDGEDTIADNVQVDSDDDGIFEKGPVKVTVSRGSAEVLLAYAGGDAVTGEEIDTDGDALDLVRDIGPIDEIAPDAGIFEFDLPVKFTDGPLSSLCKWSEDQILYASLDGSADTDVVSRFDLDTVDAAGTFCIIQGDIITVEYTDPTDASGDQNTVTDSATFDLRNGVLQSDKSVYIIGSDMILTLIEPDFDLDNDSAETYDLDIVEWDSDADTTTLGDLGELVAFDPEPTSFRETGDSTGIFQVVVEIPEFLNAGADALERGEEIVLEYSDWGPSGSDYVGDEEEDVNLTIFTSNFGATVELDQKVYTWTDKVYITIVAPDHNMDGALVDEIGNTPEYPIKISTRGQSLDSYKLVETGTDTGIFTGEIILTGFTHDADGNTETGVAGNDVETQESTGTGPTDGLLSADDDDGITVSFEFSEDETIVGSALIRWNIGEVQWLEASYPASGTGVVRVIDPDMNLNPEAVDNFVADVWSDSDAGGIDLTVTETNEATGIFEGTVFFTTTDESSGHRLRVAEGDTVTAEYEDNTLPNPYTTADELDISATSLIGTIVPPLERAPAANLRTVDAFGNSLSTVSVDQQVQITADLANGQDREQVFAYLVQIQDGNGVTVSLAWITGSLSAGQSFSPALSWIPTEAGTYTATAFVWESVDSPTALSPPVSTTITVQ